MRVLFTITPGIGHAFPTVPLAWSLRLAGHDVLVATGGDGLAMRGAGLPIEDVCPGKTIVSMVQETFAKRPDLAADYAAVDHSSFEDTQRFYAVLMNHQTDMLDRYVTLAEDYRPDLVVFSSLNLGGLVAAGRLGIPAVEHGYGLMRTSGYAHKLRAWNAEIFERHAAELPGELHAIDVAPPSLVNGVESGWPLRYLPYNGGGVLPNGLKESTERPQIAVTLGTTAPGFGGLAPVDRVIELASGIDADFVLALGDADTSELRTLPDNVRAAGWVPLNQLLRHSSGLIHHGGAGTTLTAVEAGVPQILMPDEGERHENGTAIEARGLGIMEQSEKLTAETVEAMLGDERYRTAAREVRDEIHAMPLPGVLTERLTALAGRR